MAHSRHIAVQDNDGHWYRIPMTMEDLFRDWQKMDPESDAFLSVMDSFENYRLVGGPDSDYIGEV